MKNKLPYKLVIATENNKIGFKKYVRNNIIGYYIPKSVIPYLNDEIEETYRSGVYLLVNSSEKRIYIGESQDIFERLNHHRRDETKEWFEVAFLITSGSWNKSQLHYFEQELIKMYKDTSFNVENANDGQYKELELTTEFDQLLDYETLEDVKDYLILFNIYPRQENKINLDNVFTFKCPSHNSIGYLTIDEYGRYTLLKGSILSNVEPSKHARNIAKELWNEYVNDSNKTKNFELLQNVTMNKPSALGSLINGSSCSGYTEFKYNNKTLDEFLGRNKQSKRK